MKGRVWRSIAIVFATLTALLLLCMLYRYGKRQYLLYTHPVAYAPEIAESAAQYDLNPYMVLAMIRAESSFQPDAESPVGAKGLMQIMPATGAWIAEEQGLAGDYEEAWLTDPAKNIAFGCWYLRYLADLFGGDFQKIVCAYNAGQGSVAKWLDNPDYVEHGQLTEIPFPETAAYYERVLAGYRQYRALYPALFPDVVEAGDECYNTVSEDLPCWKF